MPDHKPPSSIAYTQEAQVSAGLLSGMVGDLAIKKNNNEIKKNTENSGLYIEFSKNERTYPNLV